MMTATDTNPALKAASTGTEKPASKHSTLGVTSGRQQILYSYLKGFEVQRHLSRAQLGVMLGVFLPSVQNVFGVIMFLRLAVFVGLMGIPQAFLMVFLCCLCTLLTSLAISAICTNGIMGRGGPYFLISRSLGAGAGAAIGLLFVMANTIAIAMYVIGGVEIILMHLAPGIAIGGRQSLEKTDFLGNMTNSQRLYGLVFIFIVFLVVVAGVKVTQMLAPISLVGVIVGVVSIYIGSIVRSLTDSGPLICQLNGRTLKFDTFLPQNYNRFDVDDQQLCDAYCRVDTADTRLPIWQSYCVPNRSRITAPSDHREPVHDDCQFVPRWVDEERWLCMRLFSPQSQTRCINAVRGFHNAYATTNKHSAYMHALDTRAPTDEHDRSTACVRQNPDPSMPVDTRNEVYQDMDASFFVLLAIYFPSVTGIMTGANMSGDLAHPQKAIPMGTIAAQVFTSCIYLSLVVLLGTTMEGDFLRDRYGHSLGGTMNAAWLAWPHPYVVIIGAFCSTFGAAIQSLCSAPRLLQSIAQDDAIPLLRPLARLSAKNEPLRAQLLLFVVAVCFTMIGKLDEIAPIVQMCFLSCYAGLNLSCFINSAVGSPSWRPRFKHYYWPSHLFGFGLALFLMFASSRLKDLLAASACVLLFLLIHIYTTFRGNRKEFGDSVGGLQQSMAVSALFVPRAKKFLHDARNGNGLLLLSLTAGHRDALLNWAGHVKPTSNSLAVLQTVTKTKAEQSALSYAALKPEFDKHRVRVYFKKFIKAPDPCTSYSEPVAFNCVVRFTQCGKLKPVRIVAAQAELEADGRLFTWLLSGAHALLLHMPCTTLPAYFAPPLQGTVDLWWIADGADLLCDVAAALQSKLVWSQCAFRLFLVLPHCEHIDYDQIKSSVEREIGKGFKPLKKCQVTDCQMRVVPREAAAPYFVHEAARRARRLSALANNEITQKRGSESLQLVLDDVLSQLDTRSPPASSSSQSITLVDVYSSPGPLLKLVQHESTDAQLLIVSMPGVLPPTPAGVPLYSNYLKQLAAPFKRVLYVKPPNPNVSLW